MDGEESFVGSVGGHHEWLRAPCIGNDAHGARRQGITEIQLRNHNPRVILESGSGFKITTRFLGSTLLPFLFRVPLLKLNIRKKGTLIIKGLLRNLDNLSQLKHIRT